MHPHAIILYWFPGLEDENALPAPYAARFRNGRSVAHRSYGPPDGEGPGKPRGLMVSTRRDGTATYQPESQRWVQVRSGSRPVWLGVRHGLTPLDVQRTAIFGGHPVRLGDGHDWLIPVCDPTSSRCRLPGHDMKRDGEWIRVVDDAYGELADEALHYAAQVREAMLGGDGRVDFDLPDRDMRDLACRILALNYDLTDEEIGALRLFSKPDHYSEIVMAWIDLHGMVELLSIAIAQAREAGPAARLNPTEDTAATCATAAGEPASPESTPLPLTSGS